MPLPVNTNPNSAGTPLALLALSLVQIVAGILTTSHALLADGLFSLAACATVLVSVSPDDGGSSANLDVVGVLRRPRSAATILASALPIGLALGVFISGVSLVQTGYGLYRVRTAALYVAVLSLVARNWISRRMHSASRDSGPGQSSNSAQLGKWASIIVALSVLASLAGVSVMDGLGSIAISWILLDLGRRTGKTALFGGTGA